MMLSDKQEGFYEERFEHDGCGIGAVVDIAGRPSCRIVRQAREVLTNLSHRGASGSDNASGDGAGIMIQIPDRHLRSEAERAGFELPDAGSYGVGMLFLPPGRALGLECREIFEQGLVSQNLRLLGWREVPTDRKCLGQLALASEPVIVQAFVAGGGVSDEDLERRLFLAGKQIENGIRRSLPEAVEGFYICSLSARTLVYKGMFMASQLFEYYRDLTDERVETALALVHQRYSTNSFPCWSLAQPFRLIAHNGEINTLAGNANWMRARERTMSSSLLGEDLGSLRPILSSGASDSACFDAVLELLVRAGRSLPHSMMMMIPEATGPRYHMSADKQAFYEYHASILEPWDGPAAIIFSDGRLVGGTLDRNGLRPARYVVTTDGLVVLASETGVIDLPAERVRRKGRLKPGRMFLVDTGEGRIIGDREIKSRIARQQPYRRWLGKNSIELRGLFQPVQAPTSHPEETTRKAMIFAYTREELTQVLAPMAKNGQEPVGSMGNDAALAVFSDHSPRLSAYFKQLFAQVTNPAIDPLREGLVMSLTCAIGREGNLLEETPEHCRQLSLPHPVLTNEDVERLRSARRKDFRVCTVDALFDASEQNTGRALGLAIHELVEEAAEAVDAGASLVIISDRGVSPVRAPIPALLATAAVHHGLLKLDLRSQAGIIVESGEPREVMDFCLLSGYGASAVNPYLAFEVIHELHRLGEFRADNELEQLLDNYVEAVKKGILKTMSKMGISTLRSYHGSQLFEAVGLSTDFVSRYFPGTTSRIEGIGLEHVAASVSERHRKAFTGSERSLLDIEFGGEYSFRVDGERHLWTPVTVARLQHAAIGGDAEAYEEFAEQINEPADGPLTLRNLFDFVETEAVPLEKVESEHEIVKRFCSGAMSMGSISREAHETVALAMNGLGAASNSGEGGEDPARYRSTNGSDSRNSAIKQVASGRFGVTAEYLANAREIQIKIAQGAKPGEGGQLPGHKVTEEIASLRFSTPGVTLISPPPHHDIYSIEDLAQLVYDLRTANPEAAISVKLVSEVGVATVAAGVAKADADEIVISGYDGGTGASPLSSIKHAGSPWELGLAETQQVLVRNRLRSRVRLQVDGQIRTGRDVVIGALLGAERFGFGTSALVALGCCLLRKCHLDSCTAGIATQNSVLRQRFAGRPEHLQRYLMLVASETRRLMAQLGVRSFDDLVGRSELLDMKRASSYWKQRGLDFSSFFACPEKPEARRYRSPRASGPEEKRLEGRIVASAERAIESGRRLELTFGIRNSDRAVGAGLANRIVSRRGSEGLPDGTLDLKFEGSAGQSFGAFAVSGMTLRLIGDANDGLGKGLSGGRITVQAPCDSRFEAHENVIVGNSVLYGACGGEAFISGIAGERFAVRNSGAVAVVEGVGDHGCEYMTGGQVIVLGSTGRNFAAGMSGGVAFVLDEGQLFDTLCNLDMVELENVWRQEDIDGLHDLIASHFRWTGSPRAAHVLERWPERVGMFVKVMPIDYRKALRRLREREQPQTHTTPPTEEVFHG